jgi:competence protein ComGD
MEMKLQLIKMERYPKAAANRNGFTLLEMMIVLFVFFIIISISFFRIEPLINKHKIQSFFSQFEKDILFAQQYAISHSESIKLILYPDDNMYEIRSGGDGRLILHRTYDRNITIQLTTLGTNIIFRSNGNITKSGSLIVKHASQNYLVVFLLGKGRFYVTQL